MDSPGTPVPPPPPPPPPAVAASGGDYPAQLVVDPMDRIARWRPLFQWFLAIPHFVVSYVLGIVGEIVGFIWAIARMVQPKPAIGAQSCWSTRPRAWRPAPDPA